ncbi:GNAT family N-acetyltransferase [Paenibacillus tyrfis]|uniref:GNAT family N-acetyltransferase n=1 Tax=Paenibacillus tyrfis TaxID=1501230 RepID=UPI00209FB14B|nr:GNAT family N-acetyltransferase [Paenibacillus tyrfis]MCP1307480.1 GNAT family N-acetyltransferase [Paenibacillus tyrfis]
MDLLYRKAVPQDSPEIARLSGQLGYPAKAEQIEARLAPILNAADHVVIVAEAQSKLVGWIHAHGRLLVESPPYAEIGGLVVDQDFRGKRIGKQLVRHCEEWARTKGYQELRVRVNVTREEAHQFYKHAGFENTKMQQVFRKGL